MYHQFKQLAEVDITKEQMEVGPTTHYFMGGIRVDHDTQMSCVQGLFACGECAAGLHGANRLGGNSLSDLLVFGKRAGDGAIDYVSNITIPPRVGQSHVDRSIRSATDILNRESGKNPYLIHEDLQNVMQRYAGIARTEEDLNRALSELVRLKKDTSQVKAEGASQYNPGWHEALDLRSLLIISEAVTRAALMRQESRGAHTRVDYPDEQEEWQKYNIIIKKGKNGMEVKREERGTPPEKLSKVAYASLEELEGTNA